jgi:hypothetical protein
MGGFCHEKRTCNRSTGIGIFLQAKANFYTFRNSVTCLETTKPFYRYRNNDKQAADGSDRFGRVGYLLGTMEGVMISWQCESSHGPGPMAEVTVR